MKTLHRNTIPVLLITAAFSLMASEATVVVNSLLDSGSPGTLRSALLAAADGEPITFDPGLDGGTIELSIVGEEHSILIGEVMGMSNAPSGPISYLVGYFERDYGRSALYATNHVVIDASSLTNGITISWTGGEADPARVLAVRGDLTMKNVSITGGRSVATEILPAPDPEDEYGQLSTRARGGGLAVWGVAHLENCRLFDNSCSRAGDVPARSRDAGVFGGGIYADIVEISDCTISGNSLEASGVSGGGVFTVGGADAAEIVSTIERSSVTGNRIAGIFTYGAGVYSDGGGIGNLKILDLQNCTIADNLVDIYGPAYLYGIGYWRGGGIYMSNGYMKIQSCTIVNNEVYGVPRTNELGKPNMAGGIAATIGNAHSVEKMFIGHSIITGNTVHEFGGSTYNEDIFTGSLFGFYSRGYNRIGVLNFSQILVPVGEWDWYSLCRKHYPKTGDKEGVEPADVLDLSYGITYSPDILSVGVSASNAAVLHYTPNADSIDKVPASSYALDATHAEYRLIGSATNDFLEIMLSRLETHYGLTDFAATFTTDFETFLASVDIDPETAGNQPYTDPDGIPILTLTNTLWYGPAAIWPSQLPNYPYMEFWHRLDTALAAENIPGMGQELLGDAEWQALFASGYLAENPDIEFKIYPDSYTTHPLTLDQSGINRPENGLGDIGAIEFKPSETLIINIDGFTATNNQLQVHWNSTPDRTYTLWGASNLMSNDWSLVEGGITSTLPVNVHSFEATQDYRFFKAYME